MIPIDFAGANRTYKSPPDWDEGAYGVCADLRVQHEAPLFTCIYKFSWRDRLAVLFGRKLKVEIASGRTLAPLRVTIADIAEKIDSGK